MATERIPKKVPGASMTMRTSRHQSPSRSVSPLEASTQQFVGQILGLFELIERTIPAIVEKVGDEAANSPEIDEMLRWMSDDERSQVTSDLRSLADAMIEAAGSQVDPKTFAENGEASFTVQIPLGELTSHWVQHVAERTTRPAADRVVLQAMLPVAVSVFEVLIADLVTTSHRLLPSLLDSSEKRFTLAELEAFDEIEDARTALIETRVDSLLNGSLHVDWAAWFGGRPLEIDLSSLAWDWAKVVEVFQRRHLVIHTGGVVSKRYVSIVEGLGASEVQKVGTQMQVSQEYLLNALDQLLVLGLTLLVFCSRKLPDVAEEPIAWRYLDVINQMAQRKRWAVVKALAERAETFKVLNEAARVRSRFLRLLAAKELSDDKSLGFDPKDEDTSSWSSALKAEYSALCGNDEAAVEHGKAAVSAGDLNLWDVLNSPFLAGSADRILDREAPAKKAPAKKAPAKKAPAKKAPAKKAPAKKAPAKKAPAKKA